MRALIAFCTLLGSGAVATAEPNASPKPFRPTNIAISRPEPKLPKSFLEKQGPSTVQGVYKVCVGTDGAVAEVQPTTPIPGADEAVIEQIMSTWRFKPTNFKFCYRHAFTFAITDPK